MSDPMYYYAVRVNRVECLYNAHCETDTLGIVLFPVREYAVKAFKLRSKLVEDSRVKNVQYRYSDLCDLPTLVKIFNDNGIECEILKVAETVTLG